MRVWNQAVRVCGIALLVLWAAWILNRTVSPSFSGLLLAVAASASAFTFVPVLVVAAWRDHNAMLLTKHRAWLTLFACVNAVYCGFLFAHAFTDRHADMLRYSRIGAVLSFLLILPLLIRDFDRPGPKLFLFACMAFYLLSAA
jgi:hypothetical protein